MEIGLKEMRVWFMIPGCLILAVSPFHHFHFLLLVASVYICVWCVRVCACAWVCVGVMCVCVCACACMCLCVYVCVCVCVCVCTCLYVYVSLCTLILRWPYTVARWSKCPNQLTHVCVCIHSVLLPYQSFIFFPFFVCLQCDLCEWLCKKTNTYLLSLLSAFQFFQSYSFLLCKCCQNLWPFEAFHCHKPGFVSSNFHWQLNFSATFFKAHTLIVTMWSSNRLL